MRYDTKKWQTKHCTNEYNCWCRLIVTDDNEEALVIDAGQIDKEFADYVVKLHNQFLLTKELNDQLNKLRDTKSNEM